MVGYNKKATKILFVNNYYFNIVHQCLCLAQSLHLSQNNLSELGLNVVCKCCLQSALSISLLNKLFYLSYHSIKHYISKVFRNNYNIFVR